MDILNSLADAARFRYRDKRDATIEEAAFEARLESSVFASALHQDHLSVIAEVKKASPSKGLIVEDFDPLAQAKAYASAGAQAISVLTEPTRFLGSNAYLASISKAVSLPTLRKDFIVTSYQILEARLLGASAILLIVALLEKSTLASYLKLASQLGLDALVEVHDEQECDSALEAGASLLGINNRDLRTFTVDLHTSLRLKHRIPQQCTTVSESGIKSREDAFLLKNAGFHAILVGEHLMRSCSVDATMQSLMV
ncbi:MAG: indole-3-glycerol phosphate synthase TrpC [Sphaerochaeta sp.]|uniref:indole-3-glycerol phosphate synthase TrpC n=1 Tax=Sphaerochaeta sp. TaxID=1972642 RepID=UPI003D0F413B